MSTSSILVTQVRVRGSGDAHGESIVSGHEPYAGRAGLAVGAAFVHKCAVGAGGTLQQPHPTRHTPRAGVLEVK